MEIFIILCFSQHTYNDPLPDQQLSDLSHKNFSNETMKKVRWAVKMFHDWRNYRHSNGYEQIVCDLDNNSTITKGNFTYAVCRFITEVKKLDGSDFPEKTLYDIMVCLQFHLECMGINWKVINNTTFSDVRFTMKLRTSQGIGISVKKAEILSFTGEDMLWSLGLLGTYSPEVLLNTVVFMIGKGFALHAGKEHYNLWSPPFQSQLNFVRNSEGGIILRYTEDIGLKTNKGGLKHRKVQPKSVDLYPIKNEERCPIPIIVKYLSLLPCNRKTKNFYLQPLKRFSPEVWFRDKPRGVHTLRDTIKELCKKAGFAGYYTNHSLHSTCAMKLYHCNIDKQLIQEITGHRSLAVRSYKRTCDSQRKMASNCLFNTGKA